MGSILFVFLSCITPWYSQQAYQCNFQSFSRNRQTAKSD